MNELKIEKFCNGRCSECAKDKPGVRFGLPFVGDTAFLCWEHFRLLQESLKPGRVERVVEAREVHSCCHRHCCGCSYGGRSRSWCITESHGISRSRTNSETEGTSHGCSTSYSQTRGQSEGQSEGRSRRLDSEPLA